MANIAILLLAAGESTRMGQAKPLLPWGDCTLIEQQIDKLNKTGFPVFVVLGAHSEKIEPIIHDKSVSLVLNENWRSGLGSSISKGVEAISRQIPTADAILIALVDQPFLSTEYLQRMIAAYKPGQNSIIASGSPDGWFGVPALFDKACFPSLAQLNGEKGAKGIIRQHQTKTILVETNSILRDMDTLDSYESFLEEYQKSNQNPEN